MIFGSKDDFAIECYPEPRLPDLPHLVMGRMCVWAGGQQLGNIDDVNILDVTEEYFKELLGYLHKLTDEAVDSLRDLEAFKFLDSRYFLGYEGQSDEQIHLDAQRFGDFVFLIHWGEPFDGVKAFLLRAGPDFRVLYRRRGETVNSATITESGLREAVAGFLAWMNAQRTSGKNEKIA